VDYSHSGQLDDILRNAKIGSTDNDQCQCREFFRAKSIGFKNMWQISLLCYVNPLDNSSPHEYTSMPFNVLLGLSKVVLSAFGRFQRECVILQGTKQYRWNYPGNLDMHYHKHLLAALRRLPIVIIWVSCASRILYPKSIE